MPPIDILQAVCYNISIKRRKEVMPMGRKKKGKRPAKKLRPKQIRKLLKVVAELLIGLGTLITAIGQLLKK